MINRILQIAGVGTPNAVGLAYYFNVVSDILAFVGILLSIAVAVTALLINFKKLKSGDIQQEDNAHK